MLTSEHWRLKGLSFSDWGRTRSCCCLSTAGQQSHAGDPRLQSAQDELAQADSLSRTALREQLEQQTALTLEKRKLAAVDATHSVERAVEVGSLDAVIGAHN